MSKTSAAAKNKYAAKAYDQLRVLVYKGQKEAIAEYAKEQGLSTNAYVNQLIKEDMGNRLPDKPDQADAKEE